MIDKSYHPITFTTPKIKYRVTYVICIYSTYTFHLIHIHVDTVQYNILGSFYI
jgi:hypothetical protein